MRVAGRPAMRVARMSRTGGTRRARYDRGEEPITAELPRSPAAVLLYDTPDRETARLRTLAFDLDAKKHVDGAPAGRAAVERDADVLVAAIEAAGGRCIIDSGPTGGQHIWVALAEPLPLRQAAALGHALQRACPTLDPAPLANAATGCLRPPGSPHAAGGFQALHMLLADALDALDAPSGPEVLEALWALVPRASAEAQEVVAVPEGRRSLPDRWEQIAARGPAAGQFRDDASLARWFVTMAAVRASWSADEWTAAIPGWPWLASQLTSPQRLALARAEFEKARELWKKNPSVQIPDTSQSLLHGGGASDSHSANNRPQPEQIHLRLRQVRTWLQDTARSGSMSPAVHAVARAVLYFGHATESQRLQVGVRALAVAAAVSRTTAGAALWDLHELGMVSRVGEGIGRGADVWEVQLQLGDGLRPARGTVWATRPVFRVIGGHGAAEVYEALACSGRPLSSREIAGMLGRSPTTVTTHLNELAGWGLAGGGGRAGWEVGPADPDVLAHRLGAVEQQSAQIARFRQERQAWWQWLESRGLDQGGGRGPGMGQVVMLPHLSRQQHHPASARGDRAGPDAALARAVALVGSSLGGVVITGGTQNPVRVRERQLATLAP